MTNPVTKKIKKIYFDSLLTERKKRTILAIVNTSHLDSKGGKS